MDSINEESLSPSPTSVPCVGSVGVDVGVGVCTGACAGVSVCGCVGVVLGVCAGIGADVCLDVYVDVEEVEVIGAKVRHNGSEERGLGGVLLSGNTVEGTVDDEYPIKPANPNPSPLPFPSPLAPSLPFFFASRLISPPNSSCRTAEDTGGSCLSDRRRDIARNACPDIDRPIDSRLDGVLL